MMMQVIQVLLQIAIPILIIIAGAVCSSQVAEKEQLPGIVDTVLVGQGCSMLKNLGIIEQTLYIHTVLKKLLADIFHIILTKNIKSEASQFRKYVRIATNAGAVFTHRDIPDIMIFILNPPMASDSMTYFFRVQESC